MKYAIVTFGCRVNQADSFAIEERLLGIGGTNAPPDEADVVIVNTCSVTGNADQGARQTIRRIARNNPGVRIVATGCYATRRPDEVGALSNVTLVVRNSDKERLVDAVAQSVGLSTADRFGGGDGPCGGMLTPGTAGRTALALRVQTGCEEACSYCIIPQTRGASRSRPLAGLVTDIDRAILAGYKEIWITGVHLGSYGRDLAGGDSLGTLIRTLAGVRDEVMFRISSLEPMDCTREIVDLIAASPRLAPHFHLPLQHGADEMLRAMRRPYTIRYYTDLIEYIRQRIPHASIGSDVIVGFPGELEQHVIEMSGRLSALPLTYLHVFPYSDRPGTDASGHTDKVDGTTIRRRGAAVRATGSRLAQQFRESQTGSRRRALTVDDGLSAVTDNYLKVRLASEYPRNHWVTLTLGVPGEPALDVAHENDSLPVALVRGAVAPSVARRSVSGHPPR